MVEFTEEMHTTLPLEGCSFMYRAAVRAQR